MTTAADIDALSPTHLEVRAESDATTGWKIDGAAPRCHPPHASGGGVAAWGEAF